MTCLLSMGPGPQRRLTRGRWGRDEEGVSVSLWSHGWGAATAPSRVLQVTQWPWFNLLERVQLFSLDRPLTLTSPSTDSSSRGRAGPWVAPSLPS